MLVLARLCDAVHVCVVRDAVDACNVDLRVLCCACLCPVALRNDPPSCVLCLHAVGWVFYTVLLGHVLLVDLLSF